LASDMVQESSPGTSLNSIGMTLEFIKDSMVHLEDEVSDMVEMLESLFPNTFKKEMI